MHAVWNLHDVLKVFPCNIWKLLRYIFVLNVNNFYTYICVYPVPYFGLIALREFQRLFFLFGFSPFFMAEWNRIIKSNQNVFYDCLCN